MAQPQRLTTTFAPVLALLSRCTEDELVLSFAEVEALIGAPLPMALRVDSSRWTSRYRSNVAAWRALGWMARLDYPGRRVVFQRLPDLAGER